MQGQLTVNMVKNDYTIGPTLNNILVYGLKVPRIAATTVGGSFKNHQWDETNKVM